MKLNIDQREIREENEKKNSKSTYVPNIKLYMS